MEYWKIGQRFQEVKTGMVWSVMGYEGELCVLRHAKPEENNEFYLYVKYDTQEIAAAIAFGKIVPIKG